MLSLEGKQLGNYDVIRRIRSGGMGAVYEGRQRTAFGRRVAIKVILGDYAEDRDMRRRFAREAKTIARLHHPHILPLIEFGDEQGVLYLVMPFIEGGTLTGYLRRHLPDLHEVATVFLQLLDAVEYAHEEGLIHRDIKASNVLLESRRSGPPYAYLADFGLVRTIQQDELGRAIQQTGVPIPLDQVPGTPHYMAPEQTWGVVTPATDIYALGVLLYQLLTGDLPYNDADDIEVINMHLHAPVPNPRAADASIPAELGAVVTRAMAKRAEQRFPDVTSFRTAFRSAIDGPVARLEDEAFSRGPEDDDFEIYELPPRPLSPPRSALPPRISLPPPSPMPPLRASSQQLRYLDQHPRVPGQLPRPMPAPIEFRDADAPLIPRRPRITDDPNEASPVTERRVRTTEDREDIPVRQRNIIEPLAPKKTAALDDNAQDSQQNNPQSRRLAPALHARGEQASASGLSHPVRPNGGEPALASGSPPFGRTRKKRAPLVLRVGTVLLIVLVVLLLMPRVLGVNIFPSGFPVFGASPVATITLHVQTKQLKDTFLLTASPQTMRASLATRVLPDRSATGTVSARQSVATSGLHSTPGTQASGVLLFTNKSAAPVNVANGRLFIASNGIQVRLARAIVLPPRVGSTNGIVSTLGVAVEVGPNGNLAPNALNVSCCGSPLVIVSNPAAFSGGSDAQVTHIVAQSDLDGVRAALLLSLQQQVVQHIDALLASGEVRAGVPSYTIAVTSDHPVGSEATQVNVSVSLSANVLVYDMRLASDLARQLLNNEAIQVLGVNYRERGGFTIAAPLVEQQGTNGQLYLSVAASGQWAYKVTASMEQQWRQAIKGASIPLAQSYLTTRPGISAAQIVLPFGSDHVPADEQQVVFVVE
ncbi:MAG: serine/threonine-protein kinase [Ktedonobacteraceae bacterium]